MSNITSLDILDVARALGDNPELGTAHKVAEWLTEYDRSQGGGFNYNPAINTLTDAFKGGHTPQTAVTHCLNAGNPKGRKQNASAIAAVMEYALAHKSRCHRIGLTAVAIGRARKRTVYAKIKAPLLRIEDNSAFVVMPGFRMSHRPNSDQINLACSTALETFAQGDYRQADFEYLYAGPSQNGKDRAFCAYHGSERRLYTTDQLDELLNIFVNGVALAMHEGVVTKAPTLTGYRIIDPDQPRFL